MARVVTYCRVSSEEQAQKDISIPAQRKALLPLGRSSDERGGGAPASSWTRASLGLRPRRQAPWLLPDDRASAGKHGRWTTSWSTSWTASAAIRRSQILFKSLLRQARRSQVKSITENYDPETPQGFLYEGMIEVINQFYSMNLATETLKGMRENAERGLWNGGAVPYGYRLETFMDGARERSRLVPGPDEEVETVRRMFDLSANHGIGVKRIANRLNEEGVPAPRGRYWNAGTIGFMLKNPVYVGTRCGARAGSRGVQGAGRRTRTSASSSRTPIPR